MAEECNPLETWIARAACLDPSAAPFLPNFLIISPPKTGSTWLAANLRCHPRIFIPAIKEVKYFSTYYRWLDVNWYARHFQPGGGRLKGEASPSYCMLPRRMIQVLHTLIPEMKLIFLMRDPVARAWSHARHNCLYREANFRGRMGNLDSVTDEKWRENFRHAWPLASGDYLGQLRRWLSIFARRQILVDFYERIQPDPVGLLSTIMEFIGVAPPVDWSAYPTRETILAGPPKAISDSLKDDLRLLLEERTLDLDAYLQHQFDLCIEDQWVETLGAKDRLTERVAHHGALLNGGRLAAQVVDRALLARSPSNFFAHEPDDACLETLLHENDSASPRVMEEGFHGYQIVLHRGRFVAVTLALGEVNLDALDEVADRARGDILVADSLERAKEVVMHHVVGDLRQELAALHAGQEKLCGQLRDCLGLISRVQDSLAAQQQEQARQIADCQTFVGRVRNSPLFRLRRWLAGWFTNSTV
jgi:hypothetical protein